MSIGMATNIYLHGNTFDEVSELIDTFKARGITDIKEMIRVTEDLDSTLLDYKAQAMSAVAKLNRIKTFLKD